MTPRNSFAVTFLPLLSTSAAMHTAWVLLAFHDAPTADHIGLAVWWGFLAIYHIVMTKFLQTPRELRSIVIISAVFLVCQFAVTLLLNPVYPSFTWWFAAAAMWCSVYYRSATAIFEGIKPESLIVTFEITVLTLLASAVVISGHRMDSGVLPHLCIGVLSVLIAMMRLRTLHTRINQQSASSSSGVLLIVLLLVIAACVMVFCAVISGSATDILTKITTLLSQILSAIGNGLAAFVFWLLSLFPQNIEPNENSAFDMPALPSEQIQDVPSSSGILLYLLIIGVVLGLGIVLIKLWRTVHLRGHHTNKRNTAAVIVKKLGFVVLLRSLIRKLLNRCRLQILYLRNRNTAPGLLVWLERQMRRKRMGRKKGETAAAFLARLGLQFPSCQADLHLLSQHLDRYYFGTNARDISAETIREMRRKFKQALSDNQISA